MSFEQSFDNILISIKLAWFKTKEILFSPFKLKTYLLYALLSWLALSSGGSGSGGGGNPLQGNSSTMPGRSEVLGMIFVMILFMLVATAISILLFWLSSHAQFILMDSVLKNKIDIKEYWSLRRKKGYSLFWWTLGIYFVSFIFTLMAIAVICVPIFLVKPWQNPSSSCFLIAIVALISLAALFVFLAFLLFTSIASIVVVPAMLKMENKINVWTAYKTMMPSIKKEWKALIIYIVSLYLIGSISAIIVLGLICAVFTPFIIVSAIIGFILINSKIEILFVIFCIVAVILGILLFIFILAAILPVIGVFQTTFKLSFVGKIFPEYETIAPILNERKQVIGCRTMYDSQEETVETGFEDNMEDYYGETDQEV